MLTLLLQQDLSLNRDDYFAGLRSHELRGNCDKSGGQSPARRRPRQVAMPPEAIARAVAFAIEQPADIDVGEIIVRPTAQS